MTISEMLKALEEKRNALATELNTEGLAIQEKRASLEAEYKGKETEQVFIDGMVELNARKEVQKTKRAEVLSLDEEIEACIPIKMLEAQGVSEEDLSKAAALAVTQGNGQIPYRQNNRTAPTGGNALGYRMGEQFQKFLAHTDLMGAEKVRNLGGPTFKSKNGGTFHSAASFHGIIGSNESEVDEVGADLGVEIGQPAQFDKALKDRRAAVSALATKSMFTQHPMAGGDGSLFSPESVFPGNTGGLCEFIIDNDLPLWPYPPSCFLDCIPIRRIPKSYVLFSRQTLRINNASAVGESLQLSAGTEPESRTTDNAIDFRVLKPESQFGFSQAKAWTVTYADTLPVSEEFLEDCPTVADAVETQLLENVRQEFYRQIINGDGSEGAYPEITGLLAQVGLSTRIHRGAASYMGNTTPAGDVADNIRETIVRAIFDAEAYGYSVDCIIMNHDDYTTMEFLKDEMGKPLYTEAEKNTIKGAKVCKDVRMPAGTALVGAFRQVVQVLIRRAIRLDIGWIDKQFAQDMLTLRASMRGGLLVKVPHALVRITQLV